MVVVEWRVPSDRSALLIFHLDPSYVNQTSISYKHIIARMDSPTTDQLKKIIVHHGFYHQPELVVGKEVDEISERGFPFRTEEGLDFCKVHTFDNEVRVVSRCTKEID